MCCFFKMLIMSSSTLHASESVGELVSLLSSNSSLAAFCRCSLSRLLVVQEEAQGGTGSVEVRINDALDSPEVLKAGRAPLDGQQVEALPLGVVSLEHAADRTTISHSGPKDQLEEELVSIIEPDIQLTRLSGNLP